MNRNKIWIIFALVVAVCLVTIYFLSNNNSDGESPIGAVEQAVSYEYGIITTSSAGKNSKITLYNQQGEKVQEIPLPYEGLQKGTFQQPKEYKGKLYLSVLGTNMAAGEQLIEIDLESLAVREIQTRDVPIAFGIDDQFAYVGTTVGTNKAIVKKIDIRKNEIVEELEVDGIINYIEVVNDHVYVFIDPEEMTHQDILKLDKQTLQVEKTLKSDKVTGATDGLVYDKTLYVTNLTQAGVDSFTDNLLKINIDTDQMEYEDLDDVSYQVLRQGDHLVYTHINVVTQDGSKRITAVDPKTNTKITGELQNQPVQTLAVEDKLISTDGEKVYEYDLNTLELLSTKLIQIDKDMVFCTVFFAKR